jgi:two-component system sensor histidine kinase VicK
MNATRYSPWWPRHFHHQLLVITAGIVVLALALLGGYTAHEHTTLKRQAAEAQATHLARQVAVASASLILTDRLDELEELSVRATELADTRALRILGRDARPLVQVLRPPSGPVKLVYDARPTTQPPAGVPESGVDASHVILTDSTVEAWHPVVAGELLGWVQVTQDTSTLQADHDRIWRNTIVVAALAVLVSMLVLQILLHRPLQSLSRARTFARQLVHGPGLQLPAEAAPAEFIELRDSLNEASTLLAQQRSDLQTHEAQLAEQNEQLGALFRFSQDGLLTFDRDGRVRFVNQAFLRLTRFDDAEVLGGDVKALSALLASRRIGQPSPLDIEPVFASEGQDVPPLVLTLATEPPTVLSLTGHRSEQGNVSRVLYACDITRQQQLDEMKSDFLSMAAHELRTPMVSIHGFTELMLHRTMSAEQQRDLLSRVHRHSQAMISILNELLDLARIEARRGQDLQREALDLGDLVKEAIRSYQPPEGRSPPQWEAPDGPMPVQGDRHKLQQAVLNILSNAYKYSPAGTEVRVSFLRAAADDGAARLGVAVEDQGIGLSEADLARVGERFFRVDKSGNVPGTGLGLSIVKELMTLMGGRMEISSQLGRGTTVRLWL